MPDTPLRIQNLGRETGFGSTPVREALCRLEAEQWVVSAANCGFRAAPISIEQLKDLERSRLVIETALLRESIQEGDDVWESDVVAAHYQLAKLEQLDRHYHHTLQGPLRRKFENDEKMKEIMRPALGIEHHTALMEASLSKDVAAAESLLDEHIRFATQIFVDVFDPMT